MTKAAEIESLQNYTQRLPQDSYLRPWLESVLPEVEADIRNDFPVSPSLTQARKEAAQLRTDAQQIADQIIFQARKTAEGICDQARCTAANIVQKARTAIYTAERALQAV